MPRKDRMRWLAERPTGVWLVHIKSGTELDHAVCVDAEKRLIFDNAETHPFSLTEVNLRRCGGEAFPNCYIESIRELVHTAKKRPLIFDSKT